MEGKKPEKESYFHRRNGLGDIIELRLHVPVEQQLNVTIKLTWLQRPASSEVAFYFGAWIVYLYG